MRWSLAVFGVLFPMGFLGTPAGAADVLVVRSEDSPGVLEAQRAIIEGLASRGASARTVALSDLRADTTSAERVWLAIGEEAAVRVHTMRRLDISIAHCLVSDPLHTGLDPYDFPGIDGQAPLADQLRLIQEILPKARALGVLVREGSAEGQTMVEDLRRSLPSGWTIESVPVSPEETVIAMPGWS